MHWTWHNQCGSGITEFGAMAGLGIFIAVAVLVISVAYAIECRR